MLLGQETLLCHYFYIFFKLKKYIVFFPSFSKWTYVSCAQVPCGPIPRLHVGLLLKGNIWDVVHLTCASCWHHFPLACHQFSGQSFEINNMNQTWRLCMFLTYKKKWRLCMFLTLPDTIGHLFEISLTGISQALNLGAEIQFLRPAMFLICLIMIIVCRHLYFGEC